MLGACRSDAELSYYIDFPAGEEERATVEESFLAWERVTGVSAAEADSPDRAVITLRIGPLKGDIVGNTTYSTDDEFRPEDLSSQEVLGRAEIVSEPEVWDRDWNGRLRHFNHEIGHVLTASGHSQECPSTMHANSDVCGTEEIDAQAASRARARIHDGWLSRAGGLPVQ